MWLGWVVWWCWWVGWVWCDLVGWWWCWVFCSWVGGKVSCGWAGLFHLGITLSPTFSSPPSFLSSCRPPFFVSSIFFSVSLVNFPSPSPVFSFSCFPHYFHLPSLPPFFRDCPRFLLLPLRLCFFIVIFFPKYFVWFPCLARSLKPTLVPSFFA